MPNIKPISDLRNYSEVLHMSPWVPPVFYDKIFGQLVTSSISHYQAARSQTPVMNDRVERRSWNIGLANVGGRTHQTRPIVHE